MREYSAPLRMSTNAGTKLLTVSGTVPGFGDVYFDANQMANIFGFSHLVDVGMRTCLDYDYALGNSLFHQGYT